MSVGSTVAAPALRVVASAEVRHADRPLVATSRAGRPLAAVAVTLADEALAANVDTVGTGSGREGVWLQKSASVLILRKAEEVVQ